jgi:iron complex outermembrane receptor protein
VIDATNFYAALENGTLNPFAVVQAPGVLPGDILGTATMNGISTLSDLNFILRGTPAHLASGDVGVALGATYTRETLDATADLNTEDRGWVNSPSILPIDKSRETGSFFGEVEVPIIGKGNKVPGVNLLNLDVAGRVDEYGGTVGTSKVPKVSLKYEPVDDQFSFRASAGKSFIAPQMYDLYGPINIGSSNSINYYPLNSTTELNQVQFESVSGANPALKPSTATTWTAGFGFTPEAVKGFSLTVDYFSTHQLGLPGSPDQQTVIQSVEDLGAASPYASFIHFGNPAGPGPTAPGQISGHPKSAVWIVADLDNDGGSWTKGLDATAEYVLPKREYGKFTLESTATIYTDATFAELPTLPYYSYLGDVSQNQGTVPRWRTFSTVDWKYRGWGATINHTFVPSLADVGPGGAGATAPVHVSSYSQFDATVKYSFGHDDNPVLHYFDGLTVRVGVNNVFNVNPPIALNAETETNADVGFYDGAIGRMYYVDATYKF